MTSNGGNVAEEIDTKVAWAAKDYADKNPLTTNGGFMWDLQAVSFLAGAEWMLEHMKQKVASCQICGCQTYEGCACYYCDRSGINGSCTMCYGTHP